MDHEKSVFLVRVIAEADNSVDEGSLTAISVEENITGDEYSHVQISKSSMTITISRWTQGTRRYMTNEDMQKQATPMEK